MELKRCVYCGGDAHPAECGQPIDPFPRTSSKRQIIWQAASYVAIFIASVAWVGWGPP